MTGSTVLRYWNCYTSEANFPSSGKKYATLCFASVNLLLNILYWFYIGFWCFPCLSYSIFHNNFQNISIKWNTNFHLMLSTKTWKTLKHLFILLRRGIVLKIQCIQNLFVLCEDTSWLFDLLWEAFETETAMIQPAAFWSPGPRGLLRWPKWVLEEFFSANYSKKDYCWLKQAWRYSLQKTHPTWLDKLLVLSSANRLKTLKQSIIESQNFNCVSHWCFLWHLSHLRVKCLREQKMDNRNIKLCSWWRNTK